MAFSPLKSQWLRVGIVLLAVASTRCGLFFVEVEESRVCKTVPNALFAPGIGGGQRETVKKSFAYDFGPELLQVNGRALRTEVRILSVIFVAAQGTKDLNFISKATIGLASASDGGTLPQLNVLTYEKPAGAAVNQSVTLTRAEPIDVTAYLARGKLDITAQITGTLPEQDWGLDIKTCLDVKVHYDYL